MVSASHDHRALESTHMRISSLIALTTLQDLDEHSQYNPRESYAPAVTARQSAAALQMHINKPPGYVDFELLMNDEWVLYSASLCNDLHYWSKQTDSDLYCLIQMHGGKSPGYMGFCSPTDAEGATGIAAGQHSGRQDYTSNIIDMAHSRRARIHRRTGHSQLPNGRLSLAALTFGIRSTPGLLRMLCVMPTRGDQTSNVVGIPRPQGA